MLFATLPRGVRCIHRFGLCALATTITMLAPRISSATDLCVHTTALSGWTFVLKSQKTTSGAAGSVQGYAVSDGGAAEPISGGYFVLPTHQLVLGLTRYGVAFTLSNFGGSIDFQTTFHQTYVILNAADPTTGIDSSWTREGTGAITQAGGATHLVDCKTVAKIPKKLPASP